ncbi:unnamed protein product [Zymoseptoria tritici ST99CH_1A5]|nr:unnamed protein product [Zymoseptoria tritici ST99CH_3D1]SMY27128.1 unnamed protein product [Zymoseptoria tritici ST99CH_1A5]
MDERRAALSPLLSASSSQAGYGTESTSQSRHDRMRGTEMERDNEPGPATIIVTPKVDNEAALRHHTNLAQASRYRDESSDDDTIGPGRLRTPTEFDRQGSAARASWQQQISSRIPSIVKKGWAKTVTWVKGPQPPRIYTITPFFPKLQHAPIALLDRYAPRTIQRIALLAALYCLWLMSFSLLLWKSSVAAEIPGYGNPIRLSCTARYWEDGNACGVDGNLCRPFSNTSLAFRCPADCHKVQVSNPHAVGDQEIVYKPVVVGGPADQQTGFDLVDNAVYRGDSWICASAVHSGFISDFEGGCGVLQMTGEQPSFTGGTRSNIPSTPFSSYFPQSFGFLSGTKTQCKDLRWPALAPTLVFTILISLFTTNPAVHFWSIFVVLFFHVALVSDPPSNTTYYGLVSVAFGRFLPAAFCAWVVYRYAIKRSLTHLTAQVEKTILWVGAAWVGALNNYTFDRIPIQRLTPHDIKAQPGALPALIIIILAIICIALGQAWAFRVEGRMPKYLGIYGLFVLTLLIFMAIPGLNLRIHHYILGLIFLPGTSFQNRPSLVYQGLLLGLFVNGIARWGFAPILETPASLLKGAQLESLLPAVTILAISAKNITFGLGSLPVYDSKLDNTYDGISILVNDVERFRGFSDDAYHWDDSTVLGKNYTWTWNRHGIEDGKGEEDVLSEGFPEYFRFGYMAGSDSADYTKAGVWASDGSWMEMKPGPSK